MLPSSIRRGPTSKRMAAWTLAKSASRTSEKFAPSPIPGDIPQRLGTYKFLGQAYFSHSAGESYCQPPEQDQSRAQARLQTGKRRPPKGTAPEGPSSNASESESLPPFIMYLFHVPELTPRKKKDDARQAQEWKEKKWQKDHAYDEVFTDENMAGSSNQERGEDWEDDFM